MAGAEGGDNQAMSAEDMLRELHRLFEPLRHGRTSVPTPLLIRRVPDGQYVLAITRNRWEMAPQYFTGSSAAAVIEEAWKAAFGP